MLCIVFTDKPIPTGTYTTAARIQSSAAANLVHIEYFWDVSATQRVVFFLVAYVVLLLHDSIRRYSFKQSNLLEYYYAKYCDQRFFLSVCPLLKSLCPNYTKFSLRVFVAVARFPLTTMQSVM